MIIYAEAADLAADNILIEETGFEKKEFFMHKNAIVSMLEQPMFINQIKLDLSRAKILEARIENMKDNVWKANFLIHSPGDIVDGKPDYKNVDFENYMVFGKDSVNVKIDDENFAVAYTDSEFTPAIVEDGWMDITNKCLQKDERELGNMMCAVITLKEKDTNFSLFTEIAFVFNTGKDLKMWKSLMPEIVEKITGKPAERKVV